jgi:hypothetical protein
LRAALLELVSLPRSASRVLVSQVAEESLVLAERALLRVLPLFCLFPCLVLLGLPLSLLVLRRERLRLLRLGHGVAVVAAVVVAEPAA